MMRVLRGLLALVVLLGSLVAVPWLLLGLGVYPSPGELAPQRLLLTPDDGRVVLWLVTGLGWLVWLLFTVSTAVDLAVLTGRPAVRLPGLRWMQAVSGTLLVAVLLMLGTAESPGRSASGSPAVAVAQAAPPAASAPPAGSSPSPSAGDSDGADPTWEEYTVRRGDDLWSLAEEHLGDGMEWRRIRDLNRELVDDDPDHLEPGWVLRLPVSTRTTGTPVAEEVGTSRPAEAPPVASPPVASPPAASPSTLPAPATLPIPSIPPSSSSMPAPAPPAGALPEAAREAGPEERVRLLAGTGAVLAGSLVAALAARRRRQLVQRRPGTVPERPSEASVRLRSALLADPAPGAVTLVEWAVHMVARDALVRGELGQLDWLRAGRDGIEFRWTAAPDPPPAPFRAEDGSWLVGLEEVASDRELSGDDEVLRPWPALVTVGTDGDDTYLLDLERWGRVSVHTDSAERTGEVLTSYLMELATSPWGADTEVVVVGDDGGFVDTGIADHVVRVADLDEILPAWEATAAARQALTAVADRPAPLLRLDPDFAEAWAPQVLVLLGDITPAERRRLADRFTRPCRGPLVLLSEQPGGDATLVLDESPVRAVLEPLGLALDPQRVPRAVRDSVVELARVSAPEALIPAPWWGDPTDTDPTDEDPAEELVMSDDPRLLLLGPVELEGARGTPPVRAPRQCLEYCAWLLEHPGSSSVAMARALMVAEATRRSNMSRLRTWLGNNPEGEPYLPEAYSGRIRLHPAVRSDWQEVQILLGRGVHLASDATLGAILDLVRGAPLADAPPGGWAWAEELRIEAGCVLRDVAYALAERALQAGDLDLAKWAVGRGLVAVQNDETLLRQLLVIESRAGNRRDVERLVFRLNEQARTLGVDLLPETVTAMQEVLEGGIRARAASAPRRAAV